MTDAFKGVYMELLLGGFSFGRILYFDWALPENKELARFRGNGGCGRSSNTEHLVVILRRLFKTYGIANLPNYD
jgi:hypothetical protein